MIETKEPLIDFYNYHICQGGPKQPSPRKPVTKDSYMRGHNDGWNAAVAYFKEVGKV